MDFTLGLIITTVIGTAAGISGYFLTRRRLVLALKLGKKREEELARKVYETAVLKQIGDRIGYLLDAPKIIEIISGSLGNLIPYSTVSNMVIAEGEDKIRFECNVSEPVSADFIKEVKVKMLAALTEMLQQSFVDLQLDERISGKILDDSKLVSIKSFFNLPIVISGKVVGLINISSTSERAYSEEETEVLYRISRQASEAVSKLQEVLDTEKGKLGQAVESLVDGVLMVDTDYQVVLANKKLRQMLKIVDDPKIFDVVNALSGKFDIRSKMEEAVAKSEQLTGEEIVIGDKVLQVSVSRVVDSVGAKPLGLVVLFHDVTDARALEKLRQDFTAMMVHELRSPLTGIKSTIDLIKSETSKITPEDLKKYLLSIDSTSQTMLELVGDLLDVAKLEAGKFDVVCESADLAPVIAERVEGFKPLAQERGLGLSVQISEGLPKGWFDKIRMKQVMNNLISNALKYTETGEIRVKVASELVNGVTIDILVTVADTGIGIEPEQIEKLFSRFGQLEEGRKKAGGRSSGLGLFIAKGIVEASGGKIWVESAGSGRGSTFYFTVPIAPAKPSFESQVSGMDDLGMEHQKKGVQMSGFTTKKIAQA